MQTGLGQDIYIIGVLNKTVRVWHKRPGTRLLQIMTRLGPGQDYGKIVTYQGLG